MSTYNHSTRIHLILITVFSSILYIPLVYKGTTGEYDSMRMIIGIIQSLKNNTDLAGYNYNVSFAYYYFLELFRGYFTNSYDNIFLVKNYFNVACAILTQIPLYLIIRKYWNSSIAILTGLIFAAIPVWWNLSLYGHPMIPSTLFFFFGLYLFSTNTFINSESNLKRFVLIVLSILLFAISLSFRLDVILLFPLLTAILILNNESIGSSFLKSVLIGIFSLIIFIFLQKSFGTLQVESSPQGFSKVLDRMVSWHNLDRFTDNVKKGTISFTFGIGVFYLLLFSASILLLAYKKNYKILFFLLPAVLINVLFWLPNPVPARHFVYIAPIIALGSSIFIYHLVEKYFKESNTIILSTSLAIFVASILFSESLYPLAKNHYPWKYKPQDFSWRLPIRSTPINKDKIEKYFLSSVHIPECLSNNDSISPDIIIGDPLPLIMYMQASFNDNVEFTEYTEYKDVLIYKVTIGEKIFFMPINHGKGLKEFVTGINEYFSDGEFTLLIDSTNNIIGQNQYHFNDNISVLNQCRQQ